MRVACTLAYDGTHFLGSQTQKESSNTIFGTIEHTLKKLNIETKIIASGRTDKGVHATGQVFSIDIPTHWNNLERFCEVLNRMLPNSIVIRKIREVSPTFHARYSAKSRVYRYIIKESKIINPFETNYVTLLPHVEFQKVKLNIKLFIGTHDFKNFMKTGSDISSTCRVITRAFAYKYNGYIILNFEANGFLRSQIREMVQALLVLDSNEIKQQLNCEKLHNTKPAPCNGLYLAKIKYDMI